ncbi:ribosomal protein [Mitosporidium daphniae]|uniref:Ribosomal protein n=1 Tax=Mitosporidium daphniae TaxID=1485682 RepID=A0A098VVH6_9MICR|nr:ribosomal protein [Mitosporidium daphniae]KGG52844.1 ribosomal protein [Mitosporidium daphniae]|eukprot:XP_013239271.1 ribosomal protein [Mitosporidium daphniae]
MANLSIPSKASGMRSSFFSIPEMLGTFGGSPLFSSSFQQIRGLKVGVSITRRCENCYIVVRNGIRYVYCKVNRRHKRRQG